MAGSTASATTTFRNTVRIGTTAGAQLQIGSALPTSPVADVLANFAGPAALLFPRMTTTVRDALTPTTGMVIYNTSTNKLNVHTGSAWEAVTSA